MNDFVIPDLTVIYYTANFLHERFAEKTREQLLRVIGKTPLITVSHKPMNFGENICVGDIGRSQYNIYKQVLIGTREAKTTYVATAEDDMLYSPDHFLYKPQPSVFAYDVNKWSMYSWYKPPIFSYRERRTMTSLTVTRDDLVQTLEERFARWPDPAKIPLRYFGEPGRFEGHLKITPLKHERWRSEIPSIMWTTVEGLQTEGYLGTRKKHADTRVTELPYWGTAEHIYSMYVPRVP
jgi:hypothetical protein